MEKLRGYTPETIESAHKAIIATIIDQINGALYFGGHELSQVGDRFIIKKKGEAVSVTAPSVKTIDRSYIVSLSNRAMKDETEGNLIVQLLNRVLFLKKYSVMLSRKRVKFHLKVEILASCIHKLKAYTTCIKTKTWTSV